jgi:AAA domain-containing protein
MNDDVSEFSKTYRYKPNGDADDGPRGNGADGPQSGYVPPGEKIDAAAAALFKIALWRDITFDLEEEYLIDGILPRYGVGLLYGSSQSFKSFVAMHMGLLLSLKRPWAGRQTEKSAVVYLAAEGAPGLHKRKAGYVKTWRDLPEDVDFALVSAAPNLGTADGDFARLVATIESIAIKPGLIIVDTVSKAIGGADENGAGMAQFLINAQALAQHFGCFVLAVHHTGWNEDAKDRPRGWSGLPAALDVMILSERKLGDMHATVMVQKSKDEQSGVRFTVHLERVVLGVSKTGREVSTLIVDDVAEAEAPAAKTATGRSVPKAQRLLMDVVASALDEKGVDLRPLGMDGPKVRAVADGHIRDRYFARVAEKAAPDEDESKLYDRQLKAFNRSIKAAIDAKSLIAADHKGDRFIWEP